MQIVPKAACINDLSGFGRCSLSTAISVLSVCGVQPCAVPTAVLSKHTGFPSYSFTDLSDSLEAYLDNWSDLSFDGIYTGFLGSQMQIAIVEKFIRAHCESQKIIPLVVVDTVMGDGGRLYSTYTSEMCKKMASLARLADVITPNVTEACLLSGTQYKGEELSDFEAKELGLKLLGIGAKAVVITGIRRGNSILNMTCDSVGASVDEIHRTGRVFSGTGDIFASVVTAILLRGKTLSEAVRIAGGFISEATRLTLLLGAEKNEGVLFEPLLTKLGELL